MTTPIRIDTHVWIPLTHPLAGPVRERLTFANPDRKAGGWRPNARAQHLPETWCAAEERGSYMRVPRGSIGAVQRVARDLNIAVEWAPAVTWDPTRPEIPLEDFAGSPRGYQGEAIEAVIKARQGYIVLPCGAGKTRVAALTILRLNQAAVVICPTLDIVRQWMDTFRDLTAGNVKLREVSGSASWKSSPLAPAEIAVGTVDSFVSPAACQILRSAGVAVFDEAHHLPAQSWLALVEHLGARWRFGVTATPDRPDGWGFLLEVNLGPRLYERSVRQLVADGWLYQPLVIPVDTGWRPSDDDYTYEAACPACLRKSPVEDREAFQAEGMSCPGPRTVCTAILPPDLEVEEMGGGLTGRLYVATCPTCGGRPQVNPVDLAAGRAICRTALVGRPRGRCAFAIPKDGQLTATLSTGRAGTSLATDDTREALILALAERAAKVGRRVLVLSGRKSAVRTMTLALKARGVEASGATSEIPAGRRAQIMADFRKGKIQVLFATSLADEALDVRELDTLISANPAKAAGLSVQRLGRICRPAGNQPLLFDLVDGGPSLRRQWAARRTAYTDSYGSSCLAATRPMQADKAMGYLKGT